MIIFSLLAGLPSSETFNLVSQNPDHAGLANIYPSSIVTTVINILLAGSGIAAFLFLLWGGFQWITSGGDKEALEKARRKVTNALVGLALVFGTYAILFMLSGLFGINVIRLPLQRIGTAIAPAGPGPIPAGNCACFNGGSLPSGSIAPASLNGPCFTCNSGAWGSPSYMPGDPQCPASVTCP